MDQATRAAYNALNVIVKDTEINTFLKANDPNALKQCEDAIAEIEKQNPAMKR